MPTYTVRTSQPTGNLPWYTSIHGNITPAWNSAIVGNSANGLGQSGANVLNNCVGYSQGRLVEQYNELYPTQQITSYLTNHFRIFNGNAQDWYQDAINNGFNVGSVPTYGSVGVWEGVYQGNPIGHVANFEDYDSNGWWVSNGHWQHGGQYGSWGTEYVDSNYMFSWMDSSWFLIGFIYPFDVIPTPPQPPSGAKKKMPVWMMLRRNYRLIR